MILQKKRMSEMGTKKKNRYALHLYLSPSLRTGLKNMETHNGTSLSRFCKDLNAP